MIFLCNGLSESMKRDPSMKQIPEPLTKEQFIDLIHHAHFESCIGHESLAQCLTRLTGKQILYNRKNIQVSYDDIILLISLNGRLPERPSYVEYKNRLNFSFVRFEKQTPMDIENTRNKINEIIKGEV